MKNAQLFELESLDEYVLISQNISYVQRFLRQTEGRWLFGAFSEIEGKVKLRSLCVEIPLGEIYVGVEFLPPAPAGH